MSDYKSRYMTVACPACGARVGCWCKRPSGHSGPAVAFHAARRKLVDEAAEEALLRANSATERIENFIAEQGQRLEEAEHQVVHWRGRAERAEHRLAELEAQVARLTFVEPPHLPPRDVYVEVLVPAKWEPRSVEAGRGRWRNQYYETLRHVRGWRPLVEQGEEQA